jgi:hypothetical protein
LRPLARLKCEKLAGRYRALKKVGFALRPNELLVLTPLGAFMVLYPTGNIVVTEEKDNDGSE